MFFMFSEKRHLVRRHWRQAWDLGWPVTLKYAPFLYYLGSQELDKRISELYYPLELRAEAVLVLPHWNKPEILENQQEDTTRYAETWREIQRRSLDSRSFTQEGFRCPLRLLDHSYLILYSVSAEWYRLYSNSIWN